MYLAINYNDEVVAYAETIEKLWEALENSDYDSVEAINSSISFYKAVRINIEAKMILTEKETIE